MPVTELIRTPQEQATKGLFSIKVNGNLVGWIFRESAVAITEHWILKNAGVHGGFQAINTSSVDLVIEKTEGEPDTPTQFKDTMWVENNNDRTVVFRDDPSGGGPNFRPLGPGVYTVRNAGKRCAFVWSQQTTVEIWALVLDDDSDNDLQAYTAPGSVTLKIEPGPKPGAGSYPNFTGIMAQDRVNFETWLRVWANLDAARLGVLGYALRWF